MDTNNEKQPEIRITFKLSTEEYERAKEYIGNYRVRHHWARNAFLEKVARMEANDKKAREQRMVTDADYINEMIARGLINIEGKE